MGRDIIDLRETDKSGGDSKMKIIGKGVSILENVVDAMEEEERLESPLKSEKLSIKSEPNKKLMDTVIQRLRTIESLTETNKDISDAHEVEMARIVGMARIKLMTLKKEADKEEEDDETLPTVELVKIAMERLKEMETESKASEDKQILNDIINDGLVILEPISVGPIIGISRHSEMDGMNIVEFDE